jgi:hypothetical protein
VFYFVFDVISLFALAGHPVLNFVNYTMVNAFEPGTMKLTMYLENNFVPGSYGTIQFLYGTGKNREKQTSGVFGFKYGEDTPVLAANNFGIKADFMSNTFPYRYIDIETRETDEYNPLARVYLTEEDPIRLGGITEPGQDPLDFITDDYINPFDIPHNCRILRNPIKDLRELQIRLVLRNGAKVAEVANIGMDFTFEVYSVQQAPKVPCWVNQKLLL